MREREREREEETERVREIARSAGEKVAQAQRSGGKARRFLLTTTRLFDVRFFFFSMFVSISRRLVDDVRARERKTRDGAVPDDDARHDRSGTDSGNRRAREFFPPVTAIRRRRPHPSSSSPRNGFTSINTRAILTLFSVVRAGLPPIFVCLDSRPKKVVGSEVGYRRRRAFARLTYRVEAISGMFFNLTCFFFPEIYVYLSLSVPR